MNREQMIAKASVVIAANHREKIAAAAERVVDAILPQVTTVEELEALPEGSKVVSESGEVREWSRFRSAEAMLTRLGPLTVVWQP